jgi:alpha-amylase
MAARRRTTSSGKALVGSQIMSARFLAHLTTLVVLLAARLVLAQGGYNDDRVMMQGFLWESHQSGVQRAAGGAEYEVDWRGKWYDHVRSKVEELAEAEINLVWLPPPSHGEGAGYHPQELNNLGNNYGTEAQHRELIHALLRKGIEPVADLVINHRNGSEGWATFQNPQWPSTFICADDEFWFQSPETLGAADRQILIEDNRGAPDFPWSNYPKWHGARDLDHTSGDLRKAVKDYLRRLRQFGYRGWRYDMVKGFAPGYIAEYNFDSQPTFAVGEYWDGDPYVLTQWVDGTKMYGQVDPAERACSAFDFATYERLRELINAGKYDHLPAIHFKDRTLDGFIAVNGDKTVTFLENHDTGFPQKQFDSFPKNEKLLQGYAYILTHPGVPCIYWKHYFDWGFGAQIKALVRARKYAGVHSGSYIKSEVHEGAYVAIVGDQPNESSTLIVKIGPGFGFRPDEADWALETSGEGYAVWVRKSKKALTQQAIDQPHPPLPIP